MKTIKSLCRRTFRFKNFMRLYLLGVIGFFIYGCVPEDPDSSSGKIVKQTKSCNGDWCCQIMEVKMDGITHEYLKMDRGVCHYPECKYCKEKNAIK